MLELEKEIIKEAVRLKQCGLSRDHAYGWAKRWRFLHLDYSTSHTHYEKFISALDSALIR